jgi:hypothetical protein
MADDQPDTITSAVLSGSTYERLRALRPPPFGGGSLTTVITRQIALLGTLALLLPLFGAFPASTAEFLPSTDPTRAAPQVIVLGMFGGVMVTFSATLLVAVGFFRVRLEPMTESRAKTLLDTETFAAYVGFITGGASIAVTLAYFCLGLAGGEAVAGYVQAMDGVNPFSASPVGVPVAYVALAAFTVAATLLLAESYLSVKLGELAAELGE